jgi:hypothetical protein
MTNSTAPVYFKPTAPGPHPPQHATPAPAPRGTARPRDATLHCHLTSGPPLLHPASRHLCATTIAGRRRPSTSDHGAPGHDRTQQLPPDDRCRSNWSLPEPSPHLEGRSPRPLPAEPPPGRREDFSPRTALIPL